MIFKGFFNQANPSPDSKRVVPQAKVYSNESSPFIYSWILTGQLGIGPIPRTLAHWNQLESDGFQSRFSCCYPEEQIYQPIPNYWKSEQFALPDHRSQEILTVEQLITALEKAVSVLNQCDSALYLHCFAGQERSALMAVGLVSIIQGTDLFESLAFVRQCHRKARPLYGHLDTLDQALKIIRIR
ncbi:MAG: hypothetical protein RLZZ609_1318 [Cyanobacteriota bacterium]|jgi:hypothetical protein